MNIRADGAAVWIVSPNTSRQPDEREGSNQQGRSVVDFRTTREMVGAMQARKVSARELADRAIAPIEAHDRKLNTVVLRDFERARAAPAAADQLLASCA